MEISNKKLKRKKDLSKLLLDKGYIVFRNKLEYEKIIRKWDIIDFIEQCYDKYNSYVIEKLEKLEHLWNSNINNNWLKDCYKLSKYINTKNGLRLFISNLPSVSPISPYKYTNPRFYISVDNIYKNEISKTIEPLTKELRKILNMKNSNGYIKNMGWTLVPPNSDYQVLHQDWTTNGIYHILWKKDHMSINTQLIPSLMRTPNNNDYKHIREKNGYCILFQGKLVHRGNDTIGNKNWVSSFSIELTTNSGEKEWKNENEHLINDKDWVSTPISNIN